MKCSLLLYSIIIYDNPHHRTFIIKSSSKMEQETESETNNMKILWRKGNMNHILLVLILLPRKDGLPYSAVYPTYITVAAPLERM